MNNGPQKKKITNSAMRIATVLLLALCSLASDCETSSTPVPIPPAKEIDTLMRLVSGEWFIESVQKCEFDVTSFYQNASITFDRDFTEDATFYLVSYTTKDCAPAFPPSGTIKISKTFSLSSVNISATRDDNVEVRLFDVKNNLENNLLYFDLIGNAECDAPGGRTNRRGNYSFRSKKK